VSKAGREVLADWLIVFGAVWLFVSLFLTWSHQFSPAFLSSPSGSSPLLQGAPHDPNAWQVYSDMDVVLALLALAFAAVALIGGRSARIIVLIAAVIAFAFTVHAISDPPTNFATTYSAPLSEPGYVADSPGAGVGETMAIAGLSLAIAGLALSFTAD